MAKSSAVKTEVWDGNRKRSRHSVDHTLAPTHSLVLEPSVYKWNDARVLMRTIRNNSLTSTSGALDLAMGSQSVLIFVGRDSQGAIFDGKSRSPLDRSYPSASQRKWSLTATGLRAACSRYSHCMRIPQVGRPSERLRKVVTPYENSSWCRRNRRGGMLASTSNRSTRVHRRAPRHKRKHTF